MPAPFKVTIHPSQFPQAVRGQLRTALRDRRVNPKFLYDSIKQTQQWLALHAAFAPSRTDPDCAATYDRGFAAVAAALTASCVQVISLGCGGGQKDAQLLQRLREAGKAVSYAAVDVSTPMVLVAQQAALEAVPDLHCSALVCDLSCAEDLPAVLEEFALPGAARLFACFGLIPNFEPRQILPKLAALVRPGDALLVSANLAPGPDYAAGVRRILPLYDNELTREWLMLFLLDLGVERGDGEIRFVIETDSDPEGLQRVTAWFHFTRPRQFQLDRERFGFRAGEAIRLFFSYRHTPPSMRTLLGREGLQVLGEWITRSGEEGLFLAAPATRHSGILSLLPPPQAQRVADHDQVR